MSIQIDAALVQAYQSNIDIQFQQRGSRLRSAVRMETQNAEFEFYDRIGPTDAVEVNSRHADTPLIDTPHSRRRVGLRDFDWADLIDSQDRIRMLADPTSPYTLNAVYALGRKMDDVIIAAATATANTGKTGSGTAPFPGSSEVAVNNVEAGPASNSNLTIGKLRRVRFLLDSQEASNEPEKDLFGVVSPAQIQSLLRSTEVTSSDFNSVRALVNGEIDTFMGFNFIRSNRLTIAAGIRDCLFWERQGMLLAVGKEITTDVGPRRDKRNTTQVYVCASFNSTRMWEEKVLRVKCDETV